jgi:hypothetical protein
MLTVDTEVADPAASACSDATPDDCSLRGAITLANGVPVVESVVITVPIGTYLLTVNGPGEDNNQTGDLDVLRSMTLLGSVTTITDVSGGGAGGLDDGLLEVHGAGTVLTVERMTFESSVPPADLHALHVSSGARLRM